MVSLMARLCAHVHSRRLRDARGAELVEFAMVLPLLLVLVGGVVEFGLMFQAFEVVTNAAREGARVRVLPGYTNGDAIARANAYLTASGLTPTNAPIVTPAAVPAGGAGAPAFPAFQVDVPYVYSFLLLRPLLQLIPGGPFPLTITLTGRSVMRAETVAPAP